MNNYKIDIIKKEYYPSILDYRNEMLEADSSFDGCSDLQNYEDIEKWHLNCKLFESKETLPPLYSIGFQFLYLLDDEVVGMLNFRPEAMSHPMLKKFGGHIGYSVKPSKRNQGIGSRMLKDFLPSCKAYGLDKVMITCHEDNAGSRKIIIGNGGVFDSKEYFNPDGKYIERYFITL